MLLEVQHQSERGMREWRGDLGRNLRFRMGEQEQLLSPGESDCKRLNKDIEVTALH